MILYHGGTNKGTQKQPSPRPFRQSTRGSQYLPQHTAFCSLPPREANSVVIRPFVAQEANHLLHGIETPHHHALSERRAPSRAKSALARNRSRQARPSPREPLQPSEPAAGAHRDPAAAHASNRRRRTHRPALVRKSGRLGGRCEMARGPTRNDKGLPRLYCPSLLQVLAIVRFL